MDEEVIYRGPGHPLRRKGSEKNCAHGRAIPSQIRPGNGAISSWGDPMRLGYPMQPTHLEVLHAA